MIMVNEYGSAYKRVYTDEERQLLEAAGWRLVPEKQPETPKEEAATADTGDEAAVDAPKVKRLDNELMYKDAYLSQWAQIGNLAELREIFDAKGIPYTKHTRKSDMQVELRRYIREVKAARRAESHDGQ